MAQGTIVLGQLLGLVFTALANGPANPGEHTVQFDASCLASGCYFVQFNAGAESVRRKIVLTKQHDIVRSRFYQHLRNSPAIRDV